MSERVPLFPPDMDDLLLDIMRRAQETIPFDSGVLALYDPTGQALLPHIYVGDSSHIVKPITVGQGIAGQVAETRVPALARDIRANSRNVVIDPASQSQIAAPILRDTELLGVFSLENHRPGAYDDDDLVALSLLADQAAVVIQTSRQYQRLANAHNDLLASVETRLRETEALQELATITSATLNLDEMLTNAVRITAELLDCEGAQLLMPNHAAYVLSVHGPSLYGLAESWPIQSWPLDGLGYLVETYHIGQPYVSHESPPDCSPDCRNVLVSPLNTRNRTLGVLHLINRRGGSFEKHDIDLSQTIANQIAVSIGSAQMFAAERRRADLMNQINRVSQELYATLDPKQLPRKTAQIIHKVFGHDAIYVFLLDESGETIQVPACSTNDPALDMPTDYSFPVTNGVAGRAIRTGQTQIVPDVRLDPDHIQYEDPRRLQSLLTVPLRRGEAVIGALGVSSTQLNAFTELEQDALETVSTQVNIALENARLFNQAQRRLLEQRIVHQIGQDLSAILNYRDLSEAMVQHMNRALNTSGCIVGLLEDDNSTVCIEADYRSPTHHNLEGPSMTGERFPLASHHAIADAIRKRMPIIVYANDPQAHPDARRHLDELGDHSQLVLPMIAGERVLGVVDWTDNTEGRIFTSDDIQLAQTLVAQATIAIDNALLFRQLETRALELAEANRLRSQFLATISHELRTPMNSIIGFSETLLDGLYDPLNPKQFSRVERIQHNGYNLLALINDLLDISKIDAGRMQLHIERVSIQETIVGTAQSLESDATAKGLALNLDIAPDLPLVKADPQRLQQIMTNLVSNAVKFTHEGSITIRGRVVKRDNDEFVETAVIDTGIGISEADLKIIFDEFRQADGSSTRAYGGTGLGLAITKKLVDMMHGSIHVTSKEGVGSEFAFTLPVAHIARRS
ncbi:MAG: GAF domain-containing protein [Anaerolineae bacterium]|nr:GAF domain-containing protein [Anaerolineae bacterium]